MSFISIPGVTTYATQTIEQCDILIVGDATAKGAPPGKNFEVREQGAFDAGTNMAGLTQGDISIFNIFPGKADLKMMWIDNKKPSKRSLTGAGRDLLNDFLSRVVPAVNPKVIVTMGPVATHAFLGRSDYTDIRGYPFEWKNPAITADQQCIVIPTNHPRDMTWGNYEWRFYFAYDLKRAKQFAEGHLKIANPNLIIPQSYDEAMAIFTHLSEYDRLSTDIEVTNYEVSCIGFSVSEHTGYSIPIDHRWTEEQETIIWQSIAGLLGNPSITKVGQNLVFDLYFLAYRMGILTRGKLEDTMIGSHIMYPDFLKGLGFLGSLHTTLRYWKDAVDFKNIKGEA